MISKSRQIRTVLSSLLQCFSKKATGVVWSNTWRWRAANPKAARDGQPFDACLLHFQVIAEDLKKMHNERRRKLQTLPRFGFGFGFESLKYPIPTELFWRGSRRFLHTWLQQPAKAITDSIPNRCRLLTAKIKCACCATRYFQKATNLRKVECPYKEGHGKREKRHHHESDRMLGFVSTCLWFLDTSQRRD